MDVPTPTHCLKEEVTCSVCSNVYTNPKQLPCLHIFCLTCLNDLARTSAHHGSVKCPLCQSEVAVPETGTMETLPSCLHVKNLLDIFAFKECNISEITCGNCNKKNEEASYCSHCDDFWCHGCLNAHNILKENKLHRVLALKDMGNFEDVLKRPDTLVRQTGAIADHASGDTNVAKVMNNIDCKLDTAKESSNTISNCIQLLEEETRLLDYRSKTNKERIQQTVKSLILALQQKEQELVTEVEIQTKEAQEQVKKRKDELQDQLNKRGQSISQIEALIQRGTGAEFVTSTKPIIDNLLEGLQRLQDLEMPSTTDWKTVTMFARNEEISQSLQNSGIGHLATKKTTTELNKCSVKWFQAATAGLKTEIEVITKNSVGEQCYCPGDYITVQLISAQDRNTVVEMKIIDNYNGSYMISFIPSEAGQHLPTLQVNGETAGGFPPILIKERSFTPVRVIANGILAQNLVEGVVQASGRRSSQPIEKSFKYPWGVTVNESNEIFVSDMCNNRIVVFNETGKFIWSIRHKLLNKPCGICIDNKGRIFVANRGNGKILLFNCKGEYVTAVHNGGLLKETRGMSLDAQKNLVVCDCSKTGKCVYILSPNGSILKTIGKGGLLFPFDCLYHDDKIFVSDRDAHLIKVYNHSNGRFLYEFGSNLNEPLGLGVDKLGNLLVCSGNFSNNHRVNVFTLDGRFVTAFGGSRGGELGQFGKPTSITVLRNGQIVVCEFDNCRLQVFE